LLSLTSEGALLGMKIGTQLVNATITDIKFKYDINTHDQLSSKTLHLNEIGRATISLDKAVPFEAYEKCREMGAFVLIDRYRYATVSAGMISFALRRASNVYTQALTVDRAAREQLNNHSGKVIWFTGLSGSGKSTLEKRLYKLGIRTYILDGDNVRQGLNKDLGFTDADRVENIQRIAEVAKLMVDAGLVVMTAFISPFRSERDMARSLFNKGEFIDVFVDTPLAIAEDRDPKGLYRKARRGELSHFTGIDSPYEAPEAPEFDLDTGSLSIDECVEKLLQIF
jgi:bifunctional enzyme CysN/CysC